MEFDSAHGNVHESVLGQFSHVLFSQVMFLAHVCVPPHPCSIEFCWVRAASGPFLENYLFLPLKVGFKWVFVNGRNGSKSGILGAKVGQKPTSQKISPTLTHFGISARTHFLPSSRGLEIVF